MKDEVFQRLAKVLDALPNRFPPTESGAEVRLLQKLFTPEEAAIACAMKIDAEVFTEIAIRAGTDPKETRDTLKRMVAKGLIDIRKGDGGFAYALRPFVVGFYEGQLPRMDPEMAGLFEQYFRETRGGILHPRPSLHRVIPVETAVPVQIDIHPYERASEILEKAQSWGVRECICRVQQKFLGKGCGRTLEACIVFAPVKNAFDRSKVDRAITKEEALQILRETEEVGLVHSSGNYQNGIEYICNCCSCCCGIMRGIAEYGITDAVARSGFHIVVDGGSCSACGNCIERCQFNALSLPDTVIIADDTRCVGCGLCVASCPSASLVLARRPEGEMAPTPATIEEWRGQRSSGI